ncbi:hypothetical protein ACFQT0_24540 [Hymenobacter humi]|uniref:Uncharacterized protein n=1 Tax=Hymenobacter humi TaxID=1411620 RepID=A0ABW2UAX5_9BACT
MPFAPSDRLSSPQNPRIKRLLRLQQSPPSAVPWASPWWKACASSPLPSKPAWPWPPCTPAPSLAGEAGLSSLQSLFAGRAPAPEWFEVTRPVFEKVAYREGSDGILAVLRTPPAPWPTCACLRIRSSSC